MQVLVRLCRRRRLHGEPSIQGAPKPFLVHSAAHIGHCGTQTGNMCNIGQGKAQRAQCGVSAPMGPAGADGTQGLARSR